MTKVHFKFQIDRMVEVYGARAYPIERTELIWRSVRDLSDGWMTTTVDHFIGYEQFAPLMPKWNEQISKAREVQWTGQKIVHANEAQKFSELYSSEDIHTICGEIVKRIQGDMTDNEFSSFSKMITPIADILIACKNCNSEGIYFDLENRGLTVCPCRNK